MVFQNTNDAKQALLNGQVDAIVADLPTAFYLTAAEIPKGTIVGQFQQAGGENGTVRHALREGQRPRRLVNQALTAIKSDGTLDAIEKKWLSDTVDVPVLQ